VINGGIDLEKNFQVLFLVEGLHTPEEGMLCNDEVLIKRHKKEIDYEAELCMKITEAEAKDEKSAYKSFEKVLDLIFQLYGLETGIYIKRSSGYTMAPISKETPFGKLSFRKIIMEITSPTYPPDRVKNLYSAFKFAAEKHKKLIMKGFMRHGLEYYYMALGEHDLEKRVINLFVATESLFSEGQELRYRISLRVTSLLGLIGKDRNKVFERLYELYQKRSKIVHGVERVDISWEEVLDLEKYLRDCFRIYLYLNKEKDDVLDKLDASLYDDKVKIELEKLVKNAYDKWKAERL